MRFALDADRVMQVRRHAMLRHNNYDYSQSGVDRRRKLSLQEFRDVYDGKWFARLYIFLCFPFASVPEKPPSVEL